MNYTELSIQLKESPVLRELLVFKLAEFGFESFQDLDGELKAFVLAKEFKMESVDLVKSICKADLIKVAIIEHKSQNWNQQWEANFSPIMVNDNCVIRTSFHDIKAVKYDVIIDPAMTFGTGHHETTLMMAQSLFEQPISGVDVLDMGTGTGVLAILCYQLKAKNVVAIDNDPIAVENTLANYSLNKIAPANVFLGDSALINENQFDYILANINKKNRWPGRTPLDVAYRYNRSPIQQEIIALLRLKGGKANCHDANGRYVGDGNGDLNH